VWDIDDDDRFDDDRSHDARQNLRVLPADIPGRAAQSWLSCRPWFSLCRERHFHTDASHPGCMPAVTHRCPGRSHHPGEQGNRQTMQARKPTGKYACGYLALRVIRVRSVRARCGCPVRFVANVPRPKQQLEPRAPNQVRFSLPRSSLRPPTRSRIPTTTKPSIAQARIQVCVTVIVLAPHVGLTPQD
jgi:hypothetical protein